MAALNNDPNRDQSSKQLSHVGSRQFHTLEFSLKERMHQEVVAYCKKNSLTLEGGMSLLIDRGIDNYWLMAYKALKHDLTALMENFEVYKKDNQLLTAIEAQNEELKSLLLKKGVPNQALVIAPKKGHVNKTGNISGAKELTDKGVKSERTKISLAVNEKTAEKLQKFLVEKRFFAEDTIPLLIEYGLASLDENELRVLKEEREKELPKLDAEYAVLRFKVYQYFKVNQTITIRLCVLLSENRRLKELCRLNVVHNHGARDEWDDWGSEKINELYGRYVLVNRI